jgi:hypothetical protein
LKTLSKLVWIGVPLGICGLMTDVAWAKYILCFFSGLTLWASWTQELVDQADKNTKKKKDERESDL